MRKSKSIITTESIALVDESKITIVEGTKKIHPIVIYPFVQPNDVESIRLLYEKLRTLVSENNFSKPITVVNRQTIGRSKD